MLYGKLPMIANLSVKTSSNCNFKKSFSKIIKGSIWKLDLRKLTESLSISTNFKLIFFSIKYLVKTPVPGPISRTFE